ncbi:hypothetical protein ACYHMY_28300 (plasmid) [Pseudomonas amygdali pv. morsprunorum]
MQSLDKQQLTTFAVAQPDYRVFMKERYANGVRKWELIIDSPLAGKVFSIVTAKGATKLFANADTAIDFIRETCPNNPNRFITVTYGESPS